MRRWILALLAAVLLAAGCAQGGATQPAAEGPEAMIVLRRNCAAVSERVLDDEDEIETVRQIAAWYAASTETWEGVEVSELEDCIIISFRQNTASEPVCYYQYDVEQGHALQQGEAGRYAVMSDETYALVMRLTGLDAKESAQ